MAPGTPCSCRRVRGPQLMSRYLDNPAETAKTIKRGCYHTGDIGRILIGGEVELTGRLKNMVTINGENYYPEEIETAIAARDGIKHCAIFGIPNTSFGEAFVVLVVPDDDRVNIGTLVHEEFKRANVPTRAVHDVRIIDGKVFLSFVNAIGKVLRHKMKEYYLATYAVTHT